MVNRTAPASRGRSDLASNTEDCCSMNLVMDSCRAFQGRSQEVVRVILMAVDQLPKKESNLERLKVRWKSGGMTAAICLAALSRLVPATLMA